MSDPTPEAAEIVSLEFDKTFSNAYLDYAMSVIMARSLPDVRDGLKPVQRRVLYTMRQLGLTPAKPYKKSARIVGDTIGKYHPHGDSAAYEAMVRMAQPFSLRLPLVDGQGNFGSVDSDPPAAMRYTEARLAAAGEALFGQYGEIDKDTVSFVPNYDGEETEPEVLPAPLPQLLINGTQGVAVGMATEVLPHNPGEVIDATLLLIDNPEAGPDEILEVMPGPDLPTGGVVHQLDGYRSALTEGSGRVRVRSRYEITERRGGAHRIIISEIPYLVSKSRLLEKIAEEVKKRRIEGVADMLDASDKDGIRIQIDLKRDVEPEVVANLLVKHTEVERSMGYNVTVIDNGRPCQLGLIDLIRRWIDFRKEVIYRRVDFELKEAQSELELLDGYVAAVDRTDETIATIRRSADQEEAIEGLRTLLDVNERQAKAILGLRLRRLTGMEIQSLREQQDKVRAERDRLQLLLDNPAERTRVMREELLAIREKVARERLSTLSEDLGVLEKADLVTEEEVMVITTRRGYLGRVPLSSIRAQRRGSQGRGWIKTQADDAVDNIHYGSTHDYLLAVTESGRTYAQRVFDLPVTSPGTRGRFYRNLYPEVDGELSALVPVANLDCPQAAKGLTLVMVTAQGVVKRSRLDDYANAKRQTGIRGIRLNDGDRVVAAMLARDNDDLVLVSDRGKVGRFALEDVSVQGRVTGGVRGMTLRDEDVVISAEIIPGGESAALEMLCVTEQGYGKRTPLQEYQRRGRGSRGVKGMAINDKTGALVRARVVHPAEQDLVMFSADGDVNRVRIDEISAMQRNTQGVVVARRTPLVDAVTVPRNDEPDQTNEEDSAEDE